MGLQTLTILGCGSSSGVPLINCRCPICRSKNPKNKRLRTSAWVQISGKSFLIDTATDLRQQAMRAKIRRIDAVLFTHPHADHVHGIDELRSFNFIQKSKIPVYGNDWTCEELKKKFSYIFSGASAEGGAAPELILHQVDSKAEFVEIEGEVIIPLRLVHGSKESMGYRIGSLAYVTDCNEIPESSRGRLENLDVLIIDCLRLNPHPTHFNLDQALAVARDLKPKKTFLTHLNHDLDYSKWAKKLPKGIAFAYDGLRIQFEASSKNKK